LSLRSFFIKNFAKTEQDKIALTRLDASTLVAIHDVVQSLPRLMEKRRFVQSRRRRSDEAIAPYFRQTFRFWPDVDVHTQYTVVDVFGVHQLFADQPRRVLVISSDILPFPGLPTVGSGLRTWGLGEALHSRGHEVLYAMPRDAIKGREQFVPQEVRELAWEVDTLGAVVRAADPDVVVACNWPVMDLLPTEGLKVPLVLDQHGPHLMEREHQGLAPPPTMLSIRLMLCARQIFTLAPVRSRWLIFVHGWGVPVGRRLRERKMPRSSLSLPIRNSQRLFLAMD
jgi:hypothetical protein